MRHQRPNATMMIGDVFSSHNEDGEPVEVTVLRPPELVRGELLGRQLFRIWGRRSDTQGEGWLSFGWTEDLPTPARPQPTQAEAEGNRQRVGTLGDLLSDETIDYLAKSMPNTPPHPPPRT